MRVRNGCSQGDASSAHGFRLIVIGDECSVIKIGMNTQVNSRLDETTPDLGVPDPPTSAFVGQLVFTSGEVHILHGYLPEAVSVGSYPFVVNGV